MSKYDEFDLDLKQDKISKNSTNASVLPTAEAICWWVSLSVAKCGDVSRALDCTSKNSDCSNTRSACTPCGSGYVGVARC